MADAHLMVVLRASVHSGPPGGGECCAAQWRRRAQTLADAAPGGSFDERLNWLGHEDSPAARNFGVACLLVFQQANVTGPSPLVPHDPFDAAAHAPPPAVASGTGLAPTEAPVACAARAALAADGEPLSAAVHLPAYLAAAAAALAQPLGVTLLHAAAAEAPQARRLRLGARATALGACAGDDALQAALAAAEARVPGVCWWAARVAAAQHRALVRPALSVLRAATHLHAAAAAGQAARCEPCAALRASLALERARAWQDAGSYGEAACALADAAATLGVYVSVGGALGRRTAAQEDAKAQLVLRVRRRGGALPGGAGWPRGQVTPRLTESAVGWAGWTDDSGVHAAPQLLDGDEAPAALTPLEQALVLLTAAQRRKAEARDELAGWRQAPYAEAVAAAPRSAFACQAAAALLTARREAERPRVRERALVAYQALRDSLQGGNVAAARRAELAFAVPLPTHAALRRELAGVWLKAGALGAAMEEFEAIQLWEPLISCYLAAGKAAAAEAALRARLQVEPRNPALLCSMGDLSKDEVWYARAWEASGERDGRSQRSLGRCALARKDHAAAARHFAAALSVSPLHGDVWFSLGYCHLKTSDLPRAAAAFTRAVQLDPENGEAWNNLGVLHLRARRHAPAHIALGVALKQTQASWQIYDNYAVAGVHTRELASAAHAFCRTVQLSRGARVNLDVLAALVAAVRTGRGLGGGDPAAEAACLEALPRGDSGDEDDDDDVAEATGRGAAAVLRALAAVPEVAEVSDDVSAGVKAAAECDDVGLDAAGELRRRDAQEAAALACLKAAVGVQNPEGGAWRLLATFYEAVEEPRSAREAAFKWLRQAQRAGWHEDAGAAATVAACGELLVRCVEAVLAAAGTCEANARKRETASVSMAVASAHKLAARGLGEDSAPAAALAACRGRLAAMIEGAVAEE